MKTCRLAVWLLIVATGCSGGKSLPDAPAYDSDQARSALVAALDAWKQGDAQKLPRRTPPIRFVDDDLVAGLKLSEYEIQDSDAPIALHQNVAVSLSLRDKRGKVINREAHYQIGITPGLAVLRTDH